MLLIFIIFLKKIKQVLKEYKNSLIIIIVMNIEFLLGFTQIILCNTYTQNELNKKPLFLTQNLLILY